MFDPDVVKADVLIDEGQEVVMVSDVHVGAKTWQKDFTFEMIDYIYDNDCKWGFVGDGIESNLEGSAGSPLEQTMPPIDQMRTFKKMFRKIKSRLVFFNTHDNHGGRIKRKTSINPNDLLAEFLGKEPTLPTDECNILVDGTSKGYTVMYAHGASGASTLGGKITAMNKFALHYSADIYIIGHFHTLLQWYQYRIKHNLYNEKGMMICGSMLDYFDSYGQVKNYTPNPASFGSVVIGKEGIKFNQFVNNYRLETVK